MRKINLFFFFFFFRFGICLILHITLFIMFILLNMFSVMSADCKTTHCPHMTSSHANCMEILNNYHNSHCNCQMQAVISYFLLEETFLSKVKACQGNAFIYTFLSEGNFRSKVKACQGDLYTFLSEVKAKLSAPTEETDDQLKAWIKQLDDVTAQNILAMILEYHRLVEFSYYYIHWGRLLGSTASRHSSSLWH